MDEGRRKIGGFTLIEIYTVMAVIAILISIAGLTTKTRNENLSLSVQHEKLRSLFVRAKSLTLNSVSIPGGGSFCGYGVAYDAGRLVIFADLPDSGNCASGVKAGKYDTGDVILLSSLDAFIGESGIGLACFYDEASNFATQDISFLSNLCPKSLVFIPPDPKVYVNGNTLSQSVAVGVYSKRSPQKIRKIIINKAGLIDAR